MEKSININVHVAEYRGFCAGVERAIEMVEKSLKKYGSPVYVRHEIVHNKYVVQSLKAKGVIFVETLLDIPKNTKAPVIFSAHGVSKEVISAAKDLNLFHLDATCPLVSKIHRELEILEKEGYKIVMIGHRYHPEVIGTIGQAKDKSNVILIEDKSDVEKLQLKKNQKIAYVTQTTLSIYDTKEIVKTIKEKYPNIVEPKKSDICYATSNRQLSVQELSKKVDCFYIIGAYNSSNSVRLVETAKMFGCKNAELVQNIDDFDFKKVSKYKEIGLTASASAPEELIKKFINQLKLHFNIKLNDQKIPENIKFKVPNYLN
ncbi:MAG: 4-hydroxy-3-methylbut-2-enyl diphosphate reductase [Pelagibacteraceae bacterium]|nr:4-hydroxy-3-methylbut-2-enyl diphosphate reductase [Pelagibacteraceae bacterium]